MRDGVKVEHAQAGPEGVEVTAGGERLHAATLVGADGVNGICGRALGLGGNQAVGVAIEGNIGYDRLRTNDYRGRAVLELGSRPRGLRLGLPQGRPRQRRPRRLGGEGPRLRDHLRDLCDGARHRLRRSGEPARLPAPAALAGLDARARAGRARRRRRRARRSGLRRRHVRGLSLRKARLRGGPRPARGPRRGSRALRRPADPHAGNPPLGLVERQGGARPLSRA